MSQREVPHVPELCPWCQADAKGTQTEWEAHNRATFKKLPVIFEEDAEEARQFRGGALILTGFLLILGVLFWIAFYLFPQVRHGPG